MNIIIKKICFFVTVLILTSLFVASEGTAAWKMNKNKNGIKNFYSSVKGSGFNKYFGVTTFNKSIGTIMALIDDVKSYPKWMCDNKAVEILKKKGLGKFIVYYVHDSPWPTSDRDVVVKSWPKIDEKNRTITIYIKSMKKHPMKAQNGRVRMIYLNSRFVVKYISPEKTKVTFHITFNPGGSLPAGLTNGVMKNHPYNTLSGMKKMVKLAKYKNFSGKTGYESSIIKFNQ